jgi:hypothetical protein
MSAVAMAKGVASQYGNAVYFAEEREWGGFHAPGWWVLFGVALVKRCKANIKLAKAVQAGTNETQVGEARGHGADGFRGGGKWCATGAEVTGRGTPTRANNLAEATLHRRPIWQRRKR